MSKGTAEEEFAYTTMHNAAGELIFSPEMVQAKMKQMQFLKTAIKAAWRGCLTDYEQNRINSEHTLKASFWSHLSQALPSNEYPIFLEQRFMLNGNKVIPDLLICRERTNGDLKGTIVCAIEVKFTPRGRANKTSKDIQTLHRMDEHRKQVTFVHKRHHNGVKKTYCLGSDTLYVWAGIHRKMVDTIVDKYAVKLNHFIELHPDHDIP